MTFILFLGRTLAASLGLLALAVAARAEEQAAPPAAPRLSYNKDVRPLLVENCFSCHGADSASRKADLRLDQWGSYSAPSLTHRVRISFCSGVSVFFADGGGITSSGSSE